MRERQDGHIINITSIGGQAYPPRFAAYVASKNALDGFSRCFAPEVAADGIAVTTIHMPLVRTPMIAPTGMYKNFPTISSDEAADMVVEALIKRPHEVSTRVGKFGELVHAIAPNVHQLIMAGAFQMLPDSASQSHGRRRPRRAAGDARGVRARDADARHPPLRTGSRVRVAGGLEHEVVEQPVRGDAGATKHGVIARCGR